MPFQEGKQHASAADALIRMAVLIHSA